MASCKHSILITLYIFGLYITASGAQSVTASFSTNPVDNDGTALFMCNAYNLGSNILNIERTIFSRTEPLVYDEEILQSVDDNFFRSITNNADGSKTLILTIRGVYYRFDAGTYTCKIQSGSTVLAEQSAVLNINYSPDSSNPRCSIVGSSSTDLSRSPGSEVRLACHSELGFPVVDISWSYQGCNSKTLPEPSTSDSGAYYSELRVTLSEEDNGGIFTCTISRSDGSFSNSCSNGPFVVQGGNTCDPNSMPQVTQAPPQPTEAKVIPTTMSNVLNQVSVSVTFETNPVYEGNTANLVCNVYNLGSNFVAIERTTAITTEQLSFGTTVFSPFTNDLVVSVQYNNDGSQTYRLSISNVDAQKDAGTYTCKVQTSQSSVLAIQTTSLQVNVINVPTTPQMVAPSVTALFQSNSVDEGNDAALICQVFNLGSNYVAIVRTSSSSEQLTAGTQVFPTFSSYLELLVRVNNGGSHTYTLRITGTNRYRDSGTYSCEVRTFQGVVLTTKSTYLQVNTITVPTTPEVITPSVSASFPISTVDEGNEALFICQVYNIGSNHVAITRTVSSVSEQLTVGTQVYPSYTSYIQLSVSVNNDGSQTYTMQIISSNQQRDSGTYTCEVRTSQSQTVSMQSVTLQINAIAASTVPSPEYPSLTVSFQNNPVNEGQTINLICQVYNVGQNFVSTERIVSSQIETLTVSTTALANRVSVAIQYNNDGSQTYTMTITQADPQLDAGTYTCKIETTQRQVLAFESVALQINAVTIPPTPPSGPNDPYVTVYFQTNPVDEESLARLFCQVNNHGSNIVSIERTRYSRTEKLSVGGSILPDVADHFFIAAQNANDGSQLIIITIRGVYQDSDAGTYTCKIESPDGTVLAQQSTTLNINYDPISADPRCSIVGSSADLTRQSGTEIKVGCHSQLGYPPVDISWSYTVCDKNMPIPQPTLSNSGAYYSELKVTLTEDDNGGVFTCTISRPDGSFSNSCSRGPFVVPGGTECSTTTHAPITSVKTGQMVTTDSNKNDVGDKHTGNSCNILCKNNYLIYGIGVLFCIRTLLGE